MANMRNRGKCFERDNFTCQRCGTLKGYMTCHHIVPRENGGTNALKNLITLCPICHDWVETRLDLSPWLKTRSGIIGSYPSLQTQETGGLGGLELPWGRSPVAGHPPIGKKDIWPIWVKQGRRGAKELIDQYWS